MISFDEATSLILDSVRTPKNIEILLSDSFGYVLSQEIISSVNVSPFRNSAMDGFAVHSSLLTGCSKERPNSLEVPKTIFAGDSLDKHYDKNSAVKIMTGAVVPEEFDSVVKVEDTNFDRNQVTFYKSPAPGANIRLPGEDIKVGEQLYSEGTRIKCFDQGILASIGLNKIDVYDKPTVLVASTGDELVEAGKELSIGKIYNSNAHTIVSMVPSFCENVQTVSCIKDSEEKLNSILNSNHDFIITTGSVSMGDKDLLVNSAEKNGWKRVFHKASIKPGKPIYVAKKGEQILFGLPGNPLSAAITCATFVIPALKKFSGHKNYKLPLLNASMISGTTRKFNGRLIWPGKIDNLNGELVATFSTKKSSACLTALLNTDGLIFQKENLNSIDKPNQIEIVYWNQLLDNWLN